MIGGEAEASSGWLKFGQWYFFNLHLLPSFLFSLLLLPDCHTSVLLHLHLLPMNSLLVFSFRLDCDGTSVLLYLPMNYLLPSWIEYAAHGCVSRYKYLFNLHLLPSFLLF